MFSLRLVHFEPQLLFLDISYFGFSDLYAPGKITIVEFFHFSNKFQVFLVIVELFGLTYVSFLLDQTTNLQCWTEGRSSTAVAEDFRPTATATVAEVLGQTYSRRSYM